MLVEKGNVLLLNPVCLLTSVVLALSKSKPQTESTACTAILYMLVQLLPSEGALVKQGPELFVLRWCLPFRVSECCGWETTKGKKPEEEKKRAESKKTGNERQRGYQRKPWIQIPCVTTWPLCLLNLSTAVKESSEGSEPRSLKVFPRPPVSPVHLILTTPMSQSTEHVNCLCHSEEERVEDSGFW